MTRSQAEAVLRQIIAAAFPYGKPDDDPDRQRGQDQDTANKALALLLAA